MSQRKLYASSNTTLTTLNIEKYEDIAHYENPWKIFKSGILPICLAEAYQKANGHNPLKASRAYLWLKNIREIVWYLTMLSPITFFLLIPVEHYGNSFHPPLRVPTMRYLAGHMTCLILLLVFTKESYRENRSKMWDFQNSIEFFVRTFRSLFENGSSGITDSTNEEELLAKVSEDMICTAKDVIEAEITGRPTDNKKYELMQKSGAANKLGLGKNWSFYFDEARKRTDAYRLFTWDI